MLLSAHGPHGCAVSVATTAAAAHSRGKRGASPPPRGGWGAGRSRRPFGMTAELALLLVVAGLGFREGGGAPGDGGEAERRDVGGGYVVLVQAPVVVAALQDRPRAVNQAAQGGQAFDRDAQDALHAQAQRRAVAGHHHQLT